MTGIIGELFSDTELPVIGYENFFRDFGVLSVTSEAAGYPVEHIYETGTTEFWRASNSADQSILINMGATTTVSYLGIGGHNLGTAGSDIVIQGSSDNSTYFTLHTETDVSTDDTLMILFGPNGYQYFRIQFNNNSEAVQVATMAIGPVMEVPKRMQIGFAPSYFDRDVTMTPQRTAGGHFYGMVQETQAAKVKINLPGIASDWVRDNWRPFRASALQYPFFINTREPDADTVLAWAKKPPNAVWDDCDTYRIELEAIGLL